MNTLTSTPTAVTPAAAAVMSKDREKKERYEIKTLEGGAFRVYDNQVGEWCGNAHETEGACRQIIRNLKNPKLQ